MKMDNNVIKLPFGAASEERAAGEADVKPAPSRTDYDDPIFFEIERHRAAVRAYTNAVNTDSETSKFGEHMFLFSRCLVLTRPRTRRGLIALAKYLEEQFDMEADCYGCMSIEDKIGDKPWPQVFMRTLVLSLRAMASELPEKRAAKAAAGAKEKRVKPPRRMMTGADFDEFMRLLEEPERQQAFQVDAWKLVNRHFRRLARDG
jgi:hypothetical protein